MPSAASNSFNAPPPPAESGARPRHDGGLRIAVAYFALISFGFAQPLFNMVDLYWADYRIGLFDVLAVILVFQYLPAAVLAAVRRMLRRPALRAGMDYLVAAAAGFMLLRQAQMTMHPLLNAPLSHKLMFLAVMAAGAVIIAFAVRRYLTGAVFYAGLVSPVFGAVLMFNMAGHGLPLRPAAAAPAENGGPAVMLLILDALSTDMLRTSGDGIDAEMFPNFARIASRGVWWRNAAPNHNSTLYAVPGLLKSGLSAGYGGDLEKLPAPGVFDVFEDAGYSINVYGEYFKCAGRRFNCSGYVDSKRPDFLFHLFMGFGSLYGPGFALGPLFNIHRLHKAHDHLIETARTAAPGNFYFVHLMTTHEPVVLKADGSFNPSPHRTLAPGADLPAVMKNYREQIRYMDAVMGRALEAIDSRPAEQPLILMITSDHGSCWTEACPGRNAAHASVIEPALVRIPAFLLGPSVKPRIDEDDFQSIDAAPTLCEAAGLKDCAGRGFAGVPRLHGPPPPGRPRRFFLTPESAPFDIPLPAAPVKVKADYSAPASAR